MTLAGQIVRVAARGDGVTADGRFVPGAAPGDILGDDGHLISGPHHRTPPCPHFSLCGACNLQHLDDASLSQFVLDRILGALSAWKITPQWVAPVHMSPPGARRRVSLRAIKRGAGATLGFNIQGRHELVDIEHCPVVHPDIFALFAPLRALFAARLLPKRAGGVQITRTATGLVVALHGITAHTAQDWEALSAFALDHGIAHLTIATSGGPETIVRAQAPMVSFGDVDVCVPPGAFLQATLDGEAALQRAVADITQGSKKIADLFCGLGAFALPLSRHAELLAVDGNGVALSALEDAVKQAGRPVRILRQDLFRRPLEAKELQDFDAVIVDPPRAGAMAQTQALAAARVPRLAMLSCNPNSFARDADLLMKQGYRLARLWPVGQFLWTTHVELAAEFLLD